MKQRLTNDRGAVGKPGDMSGVWMKLHLLMMSVVVFLAVAMEGLVFFTSGFFLLPVSAPARYVSRFMLAPLCLNLLLLLAAFWARGSKKLGETARIGAVSLCAAGIGLVLYAAHRFFPAMDMVLMVPVVLTILYGRAGLTALVGAVSIAG